MSPVKDLMEAVKRAMDKNKPVVVCAKCRSSNLIRQVKANGKFAGYLCLDCGKEF